jgi:hypothetical protein
MEKRIGYLQPEKIEMKPLERHVAESKWQYCFCRTCQEKRWKLDHLPGPKIDYDKLRLKDEHY